MTNPVTLERFTKNDIEAFWEFYRDPKYGEFFRRCPKIWTKDELAEFEKTTSSTLFKAVLKGDLIIGFVVLNDICWYGLTGKAGIGLFEQFQDQKVDELKLCFLALSCMGTICFDQMPLRKLSMKFLKKREDIEHGLIKAGFQKEGEFKEHVIYNGIFEDELEYSLTKWDYVRLYKEKE